LKNEGKRLIPSVFNAFCLLAQRNQFGNPIAKIQLKYFDLDSFDTKNQLFISSTSGDIYQFDRLGKRINLYSPEQ
jgi:hypothetical protein